MPLKHHRLIRIFMAALVLLPIGPVGMAGQHARAEQAPHSGQNLTPDAFTLRRMMYEQMSALSGIPWFQLAAVDQFERTLSRKDRKKDQPANQPRLLAIHFTGHDWSGWLNPNQDERNPQLIALFHGLGKDGDGDGMADPDNDADALYSMCSYLLKRGTYGESFRKALDEYYSREGVGIRIEQFAKIYAAFDKLDLFDHVFPLPLGADYSYRSTWGDNRGWGGARMHEGTDIFAGYGVPVRSASYGIIENKGWNKYGGWRIGIRDLNNNYYYYAHLSGYNKKIKNGDVVEPGQLLGWVGSSGYGRRGTQGKFPPHLHFGLYHDNGKREWSFDPYPSLRRWEREERADRRGR